MSDQIKKLFKQLESIDLELLINLQNGSVHLFESGLRKRAKCLVQIEAFFTAMEWSEIPDKNEIRELQIRAEERNKKIVSQMRNLYTVAKGELIKCRSGHVSSPYLRKSASVNRVRA